MRQGFRAVVIVVLVITGVACSARRPPTTPIPDPREGRTSVRILSAPEAERGSPDPSIEKITPAYASAENKLPEYPAYALKAGCRAGTVPVRVYIGVDGNVAAQRDIPERPLSAPRSESDRDQRGTPEFTSGVPNDQCHMAFRAAVQVAVDGWKFAPAFRLKSSPGPDRDGDGRPDFRRWEQSPVMIYLDFEFLFEVVDGKGVVRGR